MSYIDELASVSPRAFLMLPKIPEHMHDAIALWITRGIEPGSFLTAVLSNDLSRSVGYADDINRAHLIEWVEYLWSYAPSPCWGSPEAVDAWIERGGLLGIKEREDLA